MAINNLQLLSALASLGGVPPLPPPAQSMPMMLPTSTLPALPPFNEPTPGIAPPAPLPALDEGLIARLAGPAPTVQQPGFLDKLGAVLGGFGAGVQGTGPQFVQSIREQRERPQREYQARRFEATQIAEQRREREQARIQRTADEQSQREFEKFMADRQFASQSARDQAEQAFRLEMATRARDAELAEQRRRERAQQERDARLIARDYGKLTANPKIALELGGYYAGLTDYLSPEAAKFESVQARLAEIRARRTAGGGVSGDMVEIPGLGVIPYERYVKIQQSVPTPTRYITAGGNRAAAPTTQALTPEAVRQVIANPSANKATVPAQLRALAKTPAERAMVDAEIRAAGLENPPPQSTRPGLSGFFPGGTIPTPQPAIRPTPAKLSQAVRGTLGGIIGR